jgi:soluble lytic murein transglycosylase-like protein
MIPFARISSQIGWRFLSSLGFVLLIAQQPARADLWAYVDERGVTHFAAEAVDTRYQLFFRGTGFDSTRDLPEASATTLGSGMPAAGARLQAFFDISHDYKRVRHHLRASAQRHQIDYELLQALVAAESGFDADAVSPRGAVGLMQLMPATAARWGVAGDARRSVAQKLTDPATNIGAGTRHLRYLLDLYDGRTDLALAAYNAGEGAVQRAGQQIPPFKETQNYVKTVLGLYAQLKPPAPVLAQRALHGRVRMELPAVAASRDMAQLASPPIESNDSE